MSILIDENTKIVVQGLSGFQAKFDTQGSLRYGSNVVAGVVPGRKGETVLDLPMYNTVKEAVDNEGAEATVIYVPASGGKDAILEAANAGIKLAVVVSEKVPYRDFAEAYRIASDKGMRIIGPNSNGLISSGKAKMGILGNDDRYFAPGYVGVLSRSGGMNHEICNLLVRAGLGQSTAVSIGGDPMVGFNFKEGLELFQEDDETKAVAMYCEPGGRMEEIAADFVKSGGITKPVVAFVAGKFMENMPEGMPFGHAGAIIEGGSGKPSVKMKIMEDAGITVARRMDDIPELIKQFVK
jgi:succinyl-CoA synthetase alpha subunit